MRTTLHTLHLSALHSIHYSVCTRVHVCAVECSSYSLHTAYSRVHLLLSTIHCLYIRHCLHTYCRPHCLHSTAATATTSTATASSGCLNCHCHYLHSLYIGHTTRMSHQWNVTLPGYRARVVCQGSVPPHCPALCTVFTVQFACSSAEAATGLLSFFADTQTLSLYIYVHIDR